MADQRHRVHFAVHHKPRFTGLDHQFPRTRRRERAEHSYQSHLRYTAVLPVEPVATTPVEGQISCRCSFGGRGAMLPAFDPEHARKVRDISVDSNHFISTVDVRLRCRPGDPLFCTKRQDFRQKWRCILWTETPSKTCEIPCRGTTRNRSTHPPPLL